MNVYRPKEEKKFRQLLSTGWKVVHQSDGQQVEKLTEKTRTEQTSLPTKSSEEKSVQKESEEVEEVAEATSETAEDVHGGSEATKDIPDSPNAADDGQNPDNEGAEAGEGGEKGQGQKGRGGAAQSDRGEEGRGNRTRGSRGGRNRKKRTFSKEQVRIQVQRSGQGGTTGVYAPQPLKVTKELVESAEASAELLARLVGRSPLKVRKGVTVNAEQLLIALETGDDPIPAIESPDERPKLKILITPDCSGSCQDWSGVGQAWALHLAENPEVDVIYITNFNGELWPGKHVWHERGSSAEIDEFTSKLLSEVDVVVYLGDEDGRELCSRYASAGATVVAISCRCASAEKPRRTTQRKGGQGVLHWVDRCSVKTPSTWAKALELCLQQ